LIAPAASNLVTGHCAIAWQPEPEQWQLTAPAVVPHNPPLMSHYYPVT